MTGQPPTGQLPTQPQPTRAELTHARRRGRTGQPRSHSGKLVTHRWARLVHVYTSMVALLLVLFFGLTGLTLNHPEWTFGSSTTTTRETGTLPDTPLLADGSVNYLQASEFVRDEYGVSGHIDSFSVANREATISYRNPGYAADLFFDVDTGKYRLTIEQQGWVGILNDLHKGRDSGSSWAWVIDASAIFLVVIALSGLTMQFFLRKRRTSALVVAVAGGLLAVLVAWYTLR